MIGGGKASVGMVRGLNQVLGPWITAGEVSVPEDRQIKRKSGKVRLNPSTHPLPSRMGVQGVKKALSLVGKPSRDDLVICLFSGGASSMMPLPAPGLSLSEKNTVTKILMTTGASIRELNVVRRHLSQTKGGRLAELLFPARVLTLILSDVVGNHLEDIGSGPTAPDPSTYSDARGVLQKYRVWREIPASARRFLERGTNGLERETAKPGSHVFRRVFNLIIGDNTNACDAAAESLRRRGYRTLVLSTSVQGSARGAGQFISGMMRQIDNDRFSLHRPVALVLGGETTVAVKGRGKGGRNQELVLSAAEGMEGLADEVIASAGTDGLDGNTDAAGAIADGTSIPRGLSKGIDPGKYLDHHDSYNYFRKLGDLILTGPTGTNVNDITIGLTGVSKS